MLSEKLLSLFLFPLLLLALLSAGMPVFAQSMTASVDRPVISADESVVLTIVADGITGRPELEPLNQDFEVLGTSQRREVNIVNGVMSDLQSWDIELIPKSTGELIIPGLVLAGVTSNPVSLRVNEPSSDPGQNQGTVFLEVNIDNPSPFVQSQVIYTVRFFSAVRIVDGELSEPVSEKLTIRRLGDDTGFFQQRNGRRYRVLERRYAIFPRESGAIEIPPVSLRVSVPDENDSTGTFFGRVKRLTRKGAPVMLDVRAKPDAPAVDENGEPFDTSAWWLAARSVELSADWEGQQAGVSQAGDATGDPATPEFRVGEPITRALTMKVDGVTGEQLPELATPEVNGLRIYADKPEIVEQPGNESLQAQRVDKWAVIPQNEGPLTLPAVNLTWFDTIAETYRVASIPAQTVNVLPAVGSESDAQAGSETNVAEDNASSGASATVIDGATNAGATNDSDAAGVLATDAINNSQAAGRLSGQLTFWKIVAAAAILAWLVSSVLAGLFWRRGRSLQRGHNHNAQAGQQGHAASAASVSAKEALGNVSRAVKKNAPAATITKTVLQWAQQRWPRQQPRSLQEVADNYPASAQALRQQLLLLDRNAYSARSSSASNVAQGQGSSVGTSQSGADTFADLAQLLRNTETREAALNSRDSHRQMRTDGWFKRRQRMTNASQLPEL